MSSGFVRRAGFTIGALLIYRLGCNIPLPGINADVLEQLFRMPGSGDLISLLSFSGRLRVLSIFALGVTPYISAAVLLQLAGIACRRLRSLRMQGARGRQIVRRATLLLTIGLAGFQAYGIGLGLQHASGGVESPGPQFLVSTIVTLTGGAVFLAWLSEQITLFGIGNGIALILLAGIAAAFREPFVVLIDRSQRGLVTDNVVKGLIVASILITLVVVLMQRARREFTVAYGERQIGDRSFGSLSSILSVNLNPAGIIPVIFASWLLGILIILADLIAELNPRWIILVNTQLALGRAAHMVLYAALIILCTLFYAAYVFDPQDVAARLRAQGGVISSVAPGEATAAHLDRALSRTVLIGSIYLAAVCLMPEILARYADIPFFFGGQWLLILVCTVLDLDHEVRGYLGISPRGSPSAPNPRLTPSDPAAATDGPGEEA